MVSLLPPARSVLRDPAGEQLGNWLPGLSAPSAVARCQALRQVGEAGDAAVAALDCLPEVVQQLGSPSPQVRRAALDALGSAGEAAASAAGRVLALLDDRDLEVRCAAGRALGAVAGPAGVEEFGPHLLRLLRDPAPELRAAAADGLGFMRAWCFADELRPCLADRDPAVSAAALGAVAKWGEDAQPLLSAVAGRLTAPHPLGRAAAARALAAAGEAGGLHAEAVAGLLQDAHAPCRAAAAGFFAGLADSKSAARRAGARAAEGLASSDEGVQAACATALGHMKACKFAGQVAGLLGREHSADASAALVATGLERRIPATLRRAACAAAEALGQMGEEGAAHADAVAALLEDPATHFELTASCARALGLMRAMAHEERVRALLDHASPVVREAACFALGELSLAPESVPAVDAVAWRLWDAHPAVRRAAAEAVGKMALEGPMYLDDVVHLFGDRVASVQGAAVRAVGSLGPRGQLYAPRVARLAFEGPALASRVAAIEVLGAMGDVEGAPYAEDLAALLADPSRQIRVAAARALGVLGRGALGVLEQLRRARSDPVEEVRAAADDVLAALGAA